MRILSTIIFLIPAIGFGQTTKEILVHSKELQADRRIWVNTPAYYDLRKDSLPMLFLLDGNNKSLLDYTIAAKRYSEKNAVDLSDFNSPESIIVGIEQAADRWDDFGDSINSQKFLLFLQNEVIPFIKEKYRTVNYSILIGHSLGGYFAINTLLKKPDLFNAFIAASPAFPARSLQSILPAFDNLLKPGFTFDKALYFSTTYLKGDATEQDFREFAETLATYLKRTPGRNFRFRFGSSASVGHGKSPFFSIPEGLSFIYDPSLWQINTDSLFSSHSTSYSAVQKYQQQMQNRVGVRMSSHVFTSILVDEFLKSNKSTQAIELLKTEVYNQPDDIGLLVQLLALLKKNKSAEYGSYQTRMKEIFRELKIPEQDQLKWLDEVEQNSR